MDVLFTDTIINRFNEGDDLELKRKCFIISQDIKEGKLVIPHLIEQLQNLLVNVSPTKRVVGVVILTEVLNNLPDDFLNNQQIETISLFYTEKLNDHHQVVPAVLRGILTLIEFKHFPGEVLYPVVNAIFNNIACQQQQQDDRRVIYTIFQVLLDKYKANVLSMGLDFVYGVICSIDGERDPRNLLFLFKWLKTFLVVFPLGHLVGEVFEVIACYFPIDFRTPNHSNSISRESLVESLCLCLCAIPEFAEYSIPLALEKLDSSLEIAKVDSLAILEEGCNSFEVSSYVKYSTTIWSQLQKEIFSGADNKIKLKCLKALTVIMNKLSRASDGYFISILKDILSTLKGNLLPESKLFISSTDILLHIALASWESSAFIVKEVVPALINIFGIVESSEEKSIILKTLIKFVKAYQSQYGDMNSNKFEYLETILMLMLKTLSELDTNLQITGFDSLSELTGILPLNIRISLYKILQEVLIQPKEECVRISILNCFKQLSCSYQDEIKDHVLYKRKISNPLLLDLYLDALTVVANLSYFRNTFSDIIMIYAFDDDYSLSFIALKNLKNILELVPNDSLLVKLFHDQKIIDKLIEYGTIQVVIDKKPNYELLQCISSVLKILIGAQDGETQSKTIEHQLNVLTSCKEQSELYIFLLDGLLSRLRRVLSVETSIIHLLIKISLIHENYMVRDVATQLLANLINKLSNDCQLNKFLTIIEEDYLKSTNYNKINVIGAGIWITKALIMRNHVQGNLWMKWLLDMFELDIEFARGLKIIMNDNYESLSSKSYCNKTLFYRQKSFVYITNELRLNYKMGKSSYLYAVGYLLESAPEQAIILQFKKILLLVIHCLEYCNDAEILCIVLKRLKHFTEQNEQIIQENLEDFILRILNLTTFEHSMMVRIAALECLTAYTMSLPIYRILPFKQKVLHQLGICIDDKKRLVRKEATEARSAWFIIDAPI